MIGGADSRGSLAGVHVLLVDDDPDSLALITALLRYTGALVTARRSTESALGAIARVRPDVLVTDVRLDDEHAYALAKALRTLPRERGGGVPALALVALASPADAERILANGFQAYLTKPLQVSDLARAISGLVSRASPERRGDR